MLQQGLDLKYFYKRSVSCEQEIDTPLSKLWEIISKPSHLEQFHPFCKKNEALKWPGIESQDILTYLNGKAYKREVIEWNVKESFSLIIGEDDGPKSYVKWQFKNNIRNTNVKITVYPHLLIGWPKIFSYLPYKWYITPHLKSYLKAVLSGLKQYAENGEIIKENMLGVHPWFS